MLFLIKVLKNASAARLRSTARWVQAQCGRKMLTIYLDMVWCALRHGAGYCDYANFGFWQLTDVLLWLALTAALIATAALLWGRKTARPAN